MLHTALRQPTLFSKAVTLNDSLFVKSASARTQILPTTRAIKKALDANWVGQIHWVGHRLQIHIPKAKSREIIIYNAKGQIYKNSLPEPISEDLRKIFIPLRGWNAITASWIPATKKLYVSDIVKKDNQVLSQIPFKDRWVMIPKIFPSKDIRTLPILSTVNKCLSVINDPNPKVAGLILRSKDSVGFPPTSLIRCNKPKF